MHRGVRGFVLTKIFKFDKVLYPCKDDRERKERDMDRNTANKIVQIVVGLLGELEDRAFLDQFDQHFLEAILIGGGCVRISIPRQGGKSRGESIRNQTGDRVWFVWGDTIEDDVLTALCFTAYKHLLDSPQSQSSLATSRPAA